MCLIAIFPLTQFLWKRKLAIKIISIFCHVCFHVWHELKKRTTYMYAYATPGVGHHVNLGLWAVGRRKNASKG